MMCVGWGSVVIGNDDGMTLKENQQEGTYTQTVVSQGCRNTEVQNELCDILGT